MKAIPIAQYLNQVGKAGQGTPDTVRQVAVFARPRVVPQIDDTEERINAAYERGLREGTTLAREEAEQARAVEQAQRVSLTEEQVRLRAKDCAILSDKIADGLADIELLVTDSVANILKPYVVELQSKQVVASLRNILNKMFSDRSSEIFEIAGPQHLIEPLREGLEHLSIKFECEPANNVDVRIVARQTVIETQLGSWRDHINTEPT